MRRPGVYLVKATGKIWLIEKLEYYKDGLTTDQFTIITKGSANGEQDFNRCLITSKQYKLFKYLGSF